MAKKIKPIEVSNNEYRAMEGISSSDIKKMAKSMAHFKYYKEHPQEDTPALLFGRASHKMILEPYDFDNEFVVAPVCDRRTKEGKEIYAKFLEESEGKDVITQEVFDQLIEMRDVLYSTPYCKKLIDGEHEKSIFWYDDKTLLKCKCRPDSFGDLGGQGIIIDYKTCEDAETEAFMRSAIKFGYDIQAAHYLDGVKAMTGKDYIFLFIAQEKKPPYAVNILQADEQFIQSGKETRDALLETYMECIEKNSFPAYMGFDNQINSLGVPSWIAKTLESEEE